MQKSMACLLVTEISHIRSLCEKKAPLEFVFASAFFRAKPYNVGRILCY